MQRTWLLLILFSVPAPAALAVEVEPLIKTLQAVGPNGAGHREAAAAWQQLATADVAQLPMILAGLDGANPLAANWIRAAVETIAERGLRQGGRLPAAELERFLLDTQHNPRARRLAFEWLTRIDTTAPGRLMPGMLNDPSIELRRDAVARLIDEAAVLAKNDKAGNALSLYQRAFSAARDLDQINLLAGQLRKLGQQVNLPRHFGFIMRWKVIGPFDNTGEKGFDVAYLPEQKLDFQATVPGKHGMVSWTDHVAKDDFGRVDFNRALAEEKGVIAYAAAEFMGDVARQVEFRLTSYNAVRLWLNGKLIDEHKVYHSGSQMDQYISRGMLQPGRNVILVKVAQNEQKQEWARFWGFQLRVCDSLGTAVLSADRKE